MNLVATSYVYPSSLPFAPLTVAELDRRQAQEDERTVVAAANWHGDRPRSEEAAMEATGHANLSMSYCEASLVRSGRYVVPVVAR